MSTVAFLVAGIGAIAGALGVVILRNPFYAVLSLVFHLLNLAALFLLLRAEFVAAAQVIVYAGAVMVLYVFVVAYVGADNAMRMRPLGGPGLRLVSIVAAAALAVELVIALLGTALAGVGTHGAQWDPGYGTPKQIGELLLTRFLLPFEIVSILLLAAAVGAVVLAGRRDGERPVSPPVPDRLPPGTGAMIEGIGVSNPTGTMNVRLRSLGTDTVRSQRTEASPAAPGSAVGGGAGSNDPEFGA